MSASIVYYVIKKNIDGAYLLDKRNDVIYTDTMKDAAQEIFNSRVSSKQKCEVYDLVAETKGKKYLQILCER